MALVEIARRLCCELAPLQFAPPVAHTYCPPDYATVPHDRYLERYGQGRKPVILLGMNPGPFGMVQTGVPFGDVAMVRDWLGITGQVKRPPGEHPKRPVLGFDCPRSEVSGQRLWGWARSRFGTPKRFFARFFVMNYCPLAFLEASARNRTPEKLPTAEKTPLLRACDEALRRSVEELRPKCVIGIGGFAETQARRALAVTGIPVGVILHPSPANPRANRGWQGIIEQQLRDQGVRI